MNNTNVSQVLSENFTHDENSTRDDLHRPNGIPGDGKSFMYVLIVRHQQFSFLFLFIFIYFLLGGGGGGGYYEKIFGPVSSKKMCSIFQYEGHRED